MPELTRTNEGASRGTLRQRMEQHRANAELRVVPQPMDPLGFGLENFDAIGAWRDQDGGVADRRLGRAARRARSFSGPERAEGDPQGERRANSPAVWPRRC